ncbi:M14 family metallocarboxypeptidase [Aciduricibacillus chroicocephali]|uniref:M14 family metallocarboxypeptidase n=1 Tax=Aciduricibacillus chroicocephali TaxID=3054939 RepID=A0ABY9KZ60_9BACI|nr:M14 family metallocarboxypeptidase [Bacillaceae bacterium 44XB]
MEKTDRVFQFNKALTYEELARKVDQLINEYPFIQKNTIGHSVLGKEIFELRIGTETEIIHYNASFHANEWITTLIAMRFLEEYASEYNKKAPQTNYALSIIPMVNPDGVDLVLGGYELGGPFKDEVIKINEGITSFSNWKANIRGVDLNKQFPAGWEIEAERKPKSPHFRDYPGYAPLTEPESIAMVQFAKENNIARLHALHTQGEEIYWGFQDFEPKESEEIVQQYAEKSGYKAVRDIDNYAGFKDWYLQEFRKPAFTLELGHGVNPLPLSQLDEIYKKSSEIFKLSMEC